MALTDAYRLNSSMKCAKYMLLIISFMFAITAVLLILVGETIQTIFGDFRQFLDDYFLSPPTLLIATGFLMFLVAMLGAWGAIKESVLIINIYGISLFIVFILEVAAAIAAFVLQGDIHVMLVRTMNESMYQYEHNQYLQNGVDFMQTGLECCGIKGPMDWKPVFDENINNTETNDIYVPPSCCQNYRPRIVNVCTEKHEVGCLGRLHLIIAQSAMLIATGASTVAFVQLLGSLCAFMLAKTLRRNKSIREARRWQLQQSLGVLIDGSKPTVIPTQQDGYQQLGEKEKYVEEYTANSPSVN